VPGLFALSRAVQKSFELGAPVLLFSDWQATGSLPASVGSLLLCAPTRLKHVPLNLELGFAPFTTSDSVALSLERFIVKSVIAARDGARVFRRSRGSAARGNDFENSDWDYAARRVAHENPDMRLAVESFIAVDSVAEDGSIRDGTRPALGNRVKRDEPRLPRLLGLRARSASPKSVRRLCFADLLLVNLHRARGPKTSALVEAILDQRAPTQPSVILAENASEVAQFLEAALLRGAQWSLCYGESREASRVSFTVLARDRVEYEQKFRYALPEQLDSEEEQIVARLARRAWRIQWGSVSVEAAESLAVQKLREAINDLRRTRPTAASRFGMTVGLFSELTQEMRRAASERLRAIQQALREVGDESGDVIVLTGNRIEQAHLLDRLGRSAPAGRVRVDVAMQLANASAAAATCVVCGYYGPITLDALLRVRPKRVQWILDPVEAAAAAFDAREQAQSLTRFGLTAPAELVTAIYEELSRASGGATIGRIADERVLHESRPYNGQHSTTALGNEEILDPDPDVTVQLSDGTTIRTSAGRRFDVVRAGAPRPRTISADQLEEGDQILIVRGSHQQTLSDLLLEEMDASELRIEAEKRNAWAELCRTMADRQHMSPTRIAREIQRLGANATSEAVRSWVRPEVDARTPLDWSTFRALAEVLNIGLPEVVVRDFFNAIRRWRVAHRSRGRDVVRLLRKAWFGGVSAAELARIEGRWGLQVRDLIEGSRLADVEAVTVRS
jgi:hypothetical protein